MPAVVVEGKGRISGGQPAGVFEEAVAGDGQRTLIRRSPPSGEGCYVSDTIAAKSACFAPAPDASSSASNCLAISGMNAGSLILL